VALDTPLVQDRIGLRVSAGDAIPGLYRPGIAHDGALLASNTNSENDMAFRAEMRIVASDRLTITPSVFYQNTRRDDIDLFCPRQGRTNRHTGWPSPIMTALSCRS
jgi:hypothetical protein